MTARGRLFFMTGKMAAGKSTLARHLATRHNAMLFVQDEWVEMLFPNMIVNVATYLEYSGRINKLIAPIVVDLLNRGTSVVMDFPGNTRNQRNWFRSIIEQAGVEHELHFVDTPDEVCRAQLKARSAHLPAGTKWTTDEDFDLISSHFRAPAEDEGFTVIRHQRS